MSTDIWTFYDAVDHVLDTFDLRRSHSRDLRLARRAVTTAYRDIPNKHRWAHLQRRHQIVTQASQSTGTVTYDHTGGTYERQLTLAGATWPSNVERGSVIINDKVHSVDESKSTTVVTLDSGNNPGADVAAGTTYQWYRSVYPLETTFIRATPLVEIGQAFYLKYASPAQWLDWTVGNYSPQRPTFFTFRSDGDLYGRMSVEFGPPPSDIRTYDFMAEVRPRALNVENYSIGTATTSTTTVTGAGTTFTSSHVGSIIRFSSDNLTEPTSAVGSLEPEDDGAYNPYFAQRRITAVASGTSLTIDEALPSEVTSVKYVISDPLDINTGAMLTCFWRMCELEMARLIRSEDYEQRMSEMPMHLRSAMAADSRNKDFNYRNVPAFFDITDWAIIE